MTSVKEGFVADDRTFFEKREGGDYVFTAPRMETGQRSLTQAFFSQRLQY